MCYGCRCICHTRSTLVDQPCTSTSSEIARGDTASAFLQRPFAEGKCILCFTDITESLQLLTLVGLQSVINNCQRTSMSHVTEYVDQHADAQHFIHRSCRLKIAYEDKKAKGTTAASTESTRVDSQCNGHILFQRHVFLLCSVCHRL